MNAGAGAVQTVAGGALIGAGTLLIALAAVGMLRLGDFYSRANAVTKAAGLGVTVVLAGVVVLDPTLSAVLLAGTAAVLQLFTVPVAGFALGRAARRSATPFAPGTRTVGRDHGQTPEG